MQGAAAAEARATEAEARLAELVAEADTLRIAAAGGAASADLERRYKEVCDRLAHSGGVMQGCPSFPHLHLEAADSSAPARGLAQRPITAAAQCPTADSSVLRLRTLAALLRCR